LKASIERNPMEYMTCFTLRVLTNSSSSSSSSSSSYCACACACAQWAMLHHT
jgi:hypothetical protein